MADPLERVTNLVTLLLNTRVPLVAEQVFFALGDAYPGDDVARHTMFERDKRVLREAGVPLQATPMSDADGRTGYRIDADEWFLPDLGLTPAEQVALHVAVAGVHLGVAWGDSALTKVADAGDGEGEREGDPGARVAVATPVADLPQLPLLVDAQRRRAPVRFTYREAARAVDPWALLLREGFWYLAGRDHDRGELRHFRVDRMAPGSVAVGEPGTAPEPQGYRPGDGFPADPKLLGEADAVEAHVRVWPPRAAAVAAEVGPDRVVARDDADGSVVVAVAVRHRPAFRSWLLGLLEHAEVLDPPELRDEVVAWLEAVAGVRGG
jgi:predicted DNA-binding transcriptional regulator YafY